MEETKQELQAHSITKREDNGEGMPNDFNNEAGLCTPMQTVSVQRVVLVLIVSCDKSPVD